MTASPLPVVIEPEAVATRLGEDNLRVVFVGEAEVFASGHVPGATRIDYAALNAQRPPVGGLLPAMSDLGQVLGQAGITPGTHVIAYDASGGGRASRLLWTLDCLGHEGWSLMNGGLTAWQAEDLPLETGEPAPGHAATPYPAALARPEARADRDYVLDHLDDPDVVVLDARSPTEYRGETVRAARGGHIPGAVNLEWTDNVDPANAGRLRPRAELERMHRELGITPEREVIAHCQTHHRSALSCVVLRYLGYPRVRGYDGSWSEWGNDPAVPVSSGPDD